MLANLDTVCISASTPLVEAMAAIDQGAAQIALVVDEQKRLIGTLTDGDVRRGFLHGATLDTPAQALMNRQFRFVRNGTDQAAVLEMMRRDGLSQIPVLDANNQVCQLLLLQELLAPTRLPNAAVIMAGGKGMRLRPHTDHCPKPMLRVDGKPMLEILIEQCIASGFRQFYISVNYLKEQIMEYFQDGGKWGVSIGYLIEDEPLGTAGSLQLLPGELQDAFLVLNGDILTRLNPSQLLRFHAEHDAAGTLCVREHITTVPFGVVQTKGVELVGFEEKPSYRQLVNAGVYVINPELLPLLPHHQAIDMPTLLQNAQQAGHRIAVCPIHEYWIDVGRPEALEEAHDTWENSK
jgi:dTDP-glucose pyrophosphorylase